MTITKKHVQKLLRDTNNVKSSNKPMKLNGGKCSKKNKLYDILVYYLFIFSLISLVVYKFSRTFSMKKIK